MSKYTVNIDDELINYFKEKMFYKENIEIVIPKLLKLLREILEIANSK